MRRTVQLVFVVPSFNINYRERYHAQHSTAQHNLSKFFKRGIGLILFTALTLAGCGGGGGGGGGGSSTTQMGGARQGIPLNLTGAVTTPVGNIGAAGAADGQGIVANFNLPAGITSDGTSLYVADSNNHTIRKIVIASGVVTTLAGIAGTIGSANGIGLAATFYYPTGITTNGTNLYVSDYANETIRQIQ